MAVGLACVYEWLPVGAHLGVLAGVAALFGGATVTLPVGHGSVDVERDVLGHEYENGEDDEGGDEPDEPARHVVSLWQWQVQSRQVQVMCWP